MYKCFVIVFLFAIACINFSDTAVLSSGIQVQQQQPVVQVQQQPVQQQQPTVIQIQQQPVQQQPQVIQVQQQQQQVSQPATVMMSTAGQI